MDEPEELGWLFLEQQAFTPGPGTGGQDADATVAVHDLEQGPERRVLGKLCVVGEQEEGVVVAEGPLLPQLAQSEVHAPGIAQPQLHGLWPVGIPTAVTGELPRSRPRFDDEDVGEIPIVDLDVFRQPVGDLRKITV